MTAARHKRVAGIPWSAEEDARLKHFAEHRTTTWDEVTAILPGRTCAAACVRLSLLKAEAEGKQVKPHKRTEQGPEDISERMQQPLAPSSLPRPKSLTAAVCGDPLPGRSALDKMKGSVA